VARGVRGVRGVVNDVMSKDAAAPTMRSERSMRGESSGARPMGSQQHIQMTQQALKDKGYDPGPIDGVQGPQTVAALKAYQKAEGLRVTGRADAETLNKLGVGIGGPSSTK